MTAKKLSDADSVELIQAVREGNPQAADVLFDRYVERLIRLVRTKISAKLARRFDAEDVVQSVYRSFFTKLREGRFELSESGDLWRLLAAISINKVLFRARHHNQKKRDVSQEESVGDGSSVCGVPFSAVQQEPTPEQAAMLTEELDRELADYTPLQREIVQLRLQGHTVEEIADTVKRTRRTVQRTLEKFRTSLEEQLRAQSVA